MPVRELHEKNDIQMSGASSGPSGPRGRTLLGLAHSKETHGKNGALQARARSESTNVRNELRGGLPDRVREGRDVRGRKGRGAADNDREAEHNPPEHRLNVSPPTTSLWNLTWVDQKWSTFGVRAIPRLSKTLKTSNPRPSTQLLRVAGRGIRSDGGARPLHRVPHSRSRHEFLLGKPALRHGGGQSAPGKHRRPPVRRRFDRGALRRRGLPPHPAAHPSAHYPTPRHAALAPPPALP